MGTKILKVDMCEHVEVFYSHSDGPTIAQWATDMMEPFGEKHECMTCGHICTVTEVGTCETCEHWRRHAPDYAFGTCLRTMHNALAGDYCYRHREASDGEAAGSD